MKNLFPLMPDYIRSKIIERADIGKLSKAWKSDKHKQVFTNGCFDILHSGHIYLLYKAAALGDKLIIGLNSDASVSRLKGKLRPVNHWNSRAILLAAISCVDAVVVFDEDTPLKLIKNIRPDVLVKGGDYRENEVIGAKEVKSWNGNIAIIPFLEGYSTTNILKNNQ